MKQEEDISLSGQKKKVLTSSVVKFATTIKKADQVSFINDIMPYFTASYVFVVSHAVYQMSGNLLVPIWLGYLLNLPYLWRKEEYKESNLDAVSERVFAKDKRFFLPLYFFVFIDALNWIWCLFVVSGSNPLQGTQYSFIFENKHGHGIMN